MVKKSKVLKGFQQGNPVIGHPVVPLPQASITEFLGIVHSQIREACEMKSKGCSPEELAAKISEIKWDDAKDRLCTLPDDLLPSVYNILFIKTLTPELLEKVDKAFGQAMILVEHLNRHVAGTMEAIEYEHNEERAVRSWLAIDEVKEGWYLHFYKANAWNMEIDALHRDIYQYLRNVFGTDDPSKVLIYDWLLSDHNLLPSETISLTRLRQLLSERIQHSVVSRITTSHEQTILDALNGVVMTQGELTNGPCRGMNRKYFLEALRTLKISGLIRNNRKVGGYFRPDALPPERVVRMSKIKT